MIPGTGDIGVILGGGVISVGGRVVFEDCASKLWFGAARR